jgi:hypothetical protein
VFHAIKIPVDRWQCRLGHPSRDIVRHVVSKNNLSCANLDKSSFSVCVMLLNPLVASGTMFPLLMTIVSLLGYTYFVTNLKSSSIFMNFKPLLTACLITKLSRFSLIAVGNMSILIPSFARLVLPIKSHVLTLINKMALLNASIVISSRWA